MPWNLPILGFEQAATTGHWLTQTDLVVDAICGTGFQGLREHHRRAAIISQAPVRGVSGYSHRVGAIRAIARGASRYPLVFDSLKPMCSRLRQAGIEVLNIGIPDEARELYMQLRQSGGRTSPS